MLKAATVLCGFDSLWQEVSWHIWSTIWIVTYDTKWCLDIIWGALCLENFWMYAVMTKLKFYVDWNVSDRKISRQIW
jgi:hypothetical protein